LTVFQQQDLVKRFVTSEVAADLQQSGFALGGRRLYCTVMFCDIRGFTALVESQPPEDTIELLNAY
jgi:class 3 adenylate cyclase